MKSAHPFSIRLKQETKDAAKEKAKQQKLTLAGYVRKLVEEDVKARKTSSILGESKEEIVIKVSSAPKKIVILVEEDSK